MSLTNIDIARIAWDETRDPNNTIFDQIAVREFKASLVDEVANAEAGRSDPRHTEFSLRVLALVNGRKAENEPKPVEPFPAFIPAPGSVSPLIATGRPATADQGTTIRLGAPAVEGIEREAAAKALHADEIATAKAKAALELKREKDAKVAKAKADADAAVQEATEADNAI